MAKRTPDLIINSKYGDWLILEEEPRPKEKYYKCKCKCGAVKSVSKSNLRLGKSKHCNKGSCKALFKKHGMANSSLYMIWCSIKTRINNPTGKNKCYKSIPICSDCLDFKNFYNWAINNGYKKGLTIDRIDSSKEYSPLNCRWVTNLVQSQNRKKHKTKSNNLPKGVYLSKPRNGKIKYKGTYKAPYYWIVIYNNKRHQRWGFSTPKEAYVDRCNFIKKHYDGLVYYD